jgi:cell wall-associated NlpC family hydrolase
LPDLSQFRDLIGVPFVDGGRTLNGADCWGLARLALKRFGYEVPDFTVSCFNSAAINGIYEAEKERWRCVEEPEPGCVVAMRIDPRVPDAVQHIGVYLGNGRFLHTLKKRESHLVRLDDPYWKGRIAGFYKWAR